MKKREPRHFVRADMMGDYLDEHDGELPRDRDNREEDELNYGCADFDDAWYESLNTHH